MPLSAGDRLGPYEILALLGKGGMGEVYRARDPWRSSLSTLARASSCGATDTNKESPICFPSRTTSPTRSHDGCDRNSLGQWDRAVAQLRAAIDLDATYWLDQIFLGRAYEQKHDFPKAIAAFEQALKLDQVH